MIQMRWKNTKQVIGDFNRFLDKFDGAVIRKMNTDMPKAFYRMEKELFNSEGGSGEHKKWKELTEIYREWKEKHYPNKTIMRRTDRGYDSLTKHTDDSVKFIGRSGSKIHVKLGTDVDYMGYHQAGIQRMGAKVARRTIDPTERGLVDFMKIIHYAIFKHTYDSKIVDNKRLKIKEARFRKT